MVLVYKEHVRSKAYKNLYRILNASSEPTIRNSLVTSSYVEKGQEFPMIVIDSSKKMSNNLAFDSRTRDEQVEFSIDIYSAGRERVKENLDLISDEIEREIVYNAKSDFESNGMYLHDFADSEIGEFEDNGQRIYHRTIGVIFDITPVEETSYTLYERYSSGDDTPLAFYTTMYGQTFTIGNTGTNVAQSIRYVRFKLYRTGNLDDNITVSLYATDGSGLPTGTALSTGCVSAMAATTNTSGDWVTIYMSPYTLQTSTKYALSFGLCGTASLNVSVRCDASSPTYAGGSMVYSSDNGVTWLAVTAIDFVFEIYGSAA